MLCVIQSAGDENLSENPRQTTINGIKKFTNRYRSLIGRIYWIITFTVLISLLAYYVYQIAETWMEHEVMLIDRSRPTYIFEIPFPAVTICPQIKFTRDKLDLSECAERYAANNSEFMSSDYGKKVYMASQICRNNFRSQLPFRRDFHEEHVINWIDTLMDLSPSSLEEVFDECQFARFDYPLYMCKQILSKVITNEGICFTFNTIRDILRADSLNKDYRYHNITKERDGWHPEKGYTQAKAYPFKGMLEGSTFVDGLTIILKTNRSNITPYCYPTNIGYKIALHSPSAYPHTYDDSVIQLGYGKEYIISVIPKTIEASKSLRSFAPQVRRCFFNNERKLQFYTFYNEHNCLLECYANFTKKEYGGVPFSSPRDPNTTVYVMDYRNEGWGLLRHRKFLYEHFKLYGEPYMNDKNITNCNCLPECSAIHYGHKIITSENVEEIIDETEIVKTVIKIIFNEPKFMGQIWVLRYTFETMLSDFGGLVGLFIGTTVLNLFQLIHFLVKRCNSISNVVVNQN